jgi:hypothetical protein
MHGITIFAERLLFMVNRYLVAVKPERVKMKQKSLNLIYRHIISGTVKYYRQ